jgi:hypothetical protein
MVSLAAVVLGILKVTGVVLTTPTCAVGMVPIVTEDGTI